MRTRGSHADSGMRSHACVVARHRTVSNVADQLRVEGRLKGLAEGQRSTLLRQLRSRFGALPADVIARVLAADGAQLDLWTERILTAPTLSAVLGEL